MKKTNKRKKKINGNIFAGGGIIPPVSNLANASSPVNAANVPINKSLAATAPSGGMSAMGAMGAATGGLQLITSTLSNINPEVPKVNPITTNSNATSNTSLMNEWGSWNPLNHYSKKDFGADTNSTIMNSLNSTVSGASSGMAVGSVVPGIGTAIGAAAGGLIGGISSLFGSSKKRKALRNANAKVDRANEATLNNFINKAGAIDTQNDWNVMANYAAYGGQLNSNSDEFSNGVSIIGEGGSHENNIYGGIPVSLDEEGNPNMLEENEVLWNDYVFSDRLMIDNLPLEEFNLPISLKNKSFAKAAELLQKESSERENDIISKNTLNNSLAKLQQLQEGIKEETNMNQNKFQDGGSLSKKPKGIYDLGFNNNNLFTPNQSNLNQTKTNNIQPQSKQNNINNSDIEEVLNVLYQDPNLSDNVKSTLRPNIMAESGGKFVGSNSYGFIGLGQMGAESFATHGYLTDEAKKKMNSLKSNKAKNRLLQDPNNWNNSEDFKNIVGIKDNNGKWISEPNKIAQAEALAKDLQWRENWINNEIQNNPTFSKWVNDNNLQMPNLLNAAGFGVGNLKNAAEGKKSSNFQQNEFNELLKRTGGSYTNEWSSKVADVPIKKNINQDAINDYNRQKRDYKNIDYKSPLEYNNKNNLIDQAQKGIKNLQPYKEQLKDTQAKQDKYNDLLRYTPVAANAGLLIADLFTKPEQFNLRTANDYHVKPDALGNYVKYSPIDSEFIANKVREQGASTDRNIINTSGGNRATATAGLLASNYNTQNAIGNAYFQTDQINDDKRFRTEEFNRGTNMFNISNDLQGQMFNASADNHLDQFNTNIKNQETLYNAQNRANARTMRRQGIANLATNIGNIGTENRWMSLAPKMFGYDQFANYMGKYNSQNKNAFGGKIYKKKIK